MNLTLAIIVPIAIAIGFTVGWSQASAKAKNQNVVGTIHIEPGDPGENDYIFLELTKNGYEHMLRHDVVKIRVDNKSYKIAE